MLSERDSECKASIQLAQQNLVPTRNYNCWRSILSMDKSKIEYKNGLKPHLIY